MKQEKETVMQHAINQRKSMAHMACIKGVLKELLDREPTNQDAILCSQRFLKEEGDSLSYLLLYNNVEIGVVTIIDNPEKHRVEFKPLKTKQ